MSNAERRWSDAILEALLHARQADDHAALYLLMDPAVRSALDEESFAQGVERLRLPVKPILWSHPHLLHEHRPLLMPLDPDSNQASELLTLSMAMGTSDAQPDSLQARLGTRIGSWLISNASLPVLQEHLGRLAVQTLPADHQIELGRTRLLRYFEPSVFSVLWDMSDPPQQEAVLGPISQWFWMARDVSGLVDLRSAIKPPPSDRVPRSSEKVLWTAAQWRHLLALDALNPVLIARGLQSADLMKAHAVMACLGRLRCAGIRHSRDLEVMAELALSHHPSFDQHPRVEDLIANRGDQYAAGALSGLKAEDWLDICEVLRQNKTKLFKK